MNLQKNINFSLDIRQVVDGDNVNLDEEAFTEDGVAVNSDFINGLNTEDAKSKMIDYIEKNNLVPRLRPISSFRYIGLPLILSGIKFFHL